MYSRGFYNSAFARQAKGKGQTSQLLSGEEVRHFRINSGAFLNATGGITKKAFKITKTNTRRLIYTSVTVTFVLMFLSQLLRDKIWFFTILMIPARLERNQTKTSFK